MEKEELLTRIERITESWNNLSPLSLSAYELLLTEETFWDPGSEVRWSRPIFWQPIGDA